MRIRTKLLAIGCAGPLVIGVLLIGCDSRAIDLSTSESRAAHEWMRPWSEDQLGWGQEIERSRWRYVIPSKEPLADSMLKSVSSVPLTESQARELSGESPRSTGSITQARPFLLRGICASGRCIVEVHIKQTGDVWIGGGVLSHRAVSIKRAPVVVWLEHAPHNIYVTFAVAE